MEAEQGRVITRHGCRKNICQEALKWQEEKEASWEVNRQLGCVPCFQADKANTVGRWECVGRQAERLPSPQLRRDGACTHTRTHTWDTIHSAALFPAMGLQSHYLHSFILRKWIFTTFCDNNSEGQDSTLFQRWVSDGLVPKI